MQVARHNPMLICQAHLHQTCTPLCFSDTSHFLTFSDRYQVRPIDYNLPPCNPIPGYFHQRQPRESCHVKFRIAPAPHLPLAQAATELCLLPLRSYLPSPRPRNPCLQPPISQPSYFAITGSPTCQAGRPLAVPHVGLDAANLQGRPPALRLAIPPVDGLQLLPIPRHRAGTVRLCVSYEGWVYACRSANLQDTPPGIVLISACKHIRSRRPRMP